MRSLRKLENSGPSHPLLSPGPGTPMLAPTFCRCSHTAAASWPVRPSPFSGTPPSPGWPGREERSLGELERKLHGRCGLRSTASCADLAHSNTNELGALIGPRELQPPGLNHE